MVPKNPDGVARSRELMSSIASRVKVPPITEEEWDDLEPVRSDIARTGVAGADYNLWQSL